MPFLNRKKELHLRGNEEDIALMRDAFTLIAQDTCDENDTGGEGAVLLQTLARKKTEVLFQEGRETGGAAYKPSINKIVINREYVDSVIEAHGREAAVGDLAFMLVHEAQHVQQDVMMNYPKLKYQLNPQGHVALGCLIESDAQRKALLVADNLKEKGFDSVWNSNANGDGFGNMKETFATHKGAISSDALAAQCTSVFYGSDTAMYYTSNALNRSEQGVCKPGLNDVKNQNRLQGALNALAKTEPYLDINANLVSAESLLEKEVVSQTPNHLRQTETRVASRVESGHFRDVSQTRASQRQVQAVVNLAKSLPLIKVNIADLETLTPPPAERTQTVPILQSQSIDRLQDVDRIIASTQERNDSNGLDDLSHFPSTNINDGR